VIGREAAIWNRFAATAVTGAIPYQGEKVWAPFAVILPPLRHCPCKHLILHGYFCQFVLSYHPEILMNYLLKGLLKL
jgi:hypothetical protein